MNFLFEAGKVMVTPGAFDLIEEFGVNWFQLLLRHRRGDFGEPFVPAVIEQMKACGLWPAQTDVVACKLAP